MRPLTAFPLAVLAAAAVMAAKPATKAAPAGPVPDSALGFSRTSVFATPAPPPVVMNTRDPGEGMVLPRMFLTAPPQIPHAIVDFVPITVTENQCLECHDQEAAEGSGAVPVPASHYRDLRNAPDEVRTRVAGARYLCVSCHVPVTQAAAAAARPREAQQK